MRLGHSWGIFAHIKAETVDLQRSQMCGKQDLNLQVRIAHMNLNHARLPIPPFPQKMVGRGGFEPPKLIAADLQSAPFGHSGTYPYVSLLIQRVELAMGLEPATC